MKRNKAAVYILLGQSNAVGHGVPMGEEDVIKIPLKNVFGLNRKENQSFDNNELYWSGYTSAGMNLAEEQDDTYSVANFLATLWQNRIDGGVELPDLYIIQIAIGAQGVTDGYMWEPKREEKLIPGKLGTVDISLFPFCKHIFGLLDESFEKMNTDYEIIGIHWRGGEEDASASEEYLRQNLKGIYSEIFDEFNRILNSPPIVLHKIVCPDHMNDMDSTGQYLENMNYINSVFDELQKLYNNISVFDPHQAPQYIPDIRGNGLFIEDAVHFTPQVNKWVAECILKNFVCITNKRLKKAFSLLVDTDESINDIAFKCGFNSFGYFTLSFTQKIGFSPEYVRKKRENVVVHNFYELEDMASALYYKPMRFIKNAPLKSNYPIRTEFVRYPDEEYRFLHECAIISFKGRLFASWYQCPENELQGHTPIVEKRSSDGGKTWSDIEVVAEDKTNKILYCPPVYGIDNGKLYMFVNQMVAPDHIHSLDLYILNEDSDKFELLWSRPIPFKLNTNVISLQNGKLMLAGRVGEFDGFPNTPAVLISDSGKIDDEWRPVKIAENGNLPDGSKFVHPEISPIVINENIYMLCRNDQRAVPIIYCSHDFGENFEEPKALDVPMWKTKVYCGTLKDGRNYIICNADRNNRSKLVLYLTKPNSTEVAEKQTLYDAEETADTATCHYPCACQVDDTLHIIATVDINDKGRGAVLISVDLK